MSCLVLIDSLPLRSFSINMTYFGLSMDLSAFGLDIFLVQLFFGAIDLLAKMGCALLLNFFGRRTVQGTSLILAGAFLFLTLTVPTGKEHPISMVARFVECVCVCVSSSRLSSSQSSQCW